MIWKTTAGIYKWDEKPPLTFFFSPHPTSSSFSSPFTFLFLTLYLFTSSHFIFSLRHTLPSHFITPYLFTSFPFSSSLSQLSIRLDIRVRLVPTSEPYASAASKVLEKTSVCNPSKMPCHSLSCSNPNRRYVYTYEYALCLLRNQYASAASTVVEQDKGLRLVA